ncbi:MAG: hypothetical protein D3904_01370 [Candidatus Electrothrix sp. EH2]|nr:hypothetical protein [Candidatus Electrothrix sp. EH2]
MIDLSAGRKAVVVGLGKSGLAAVRYLHRQGLKVAVSESRETVPAEEQSVLEQCGAILETGGHRAAFFVDADLVIPSPGVPANLPALAAARTRGVPVVGELALAAGRIQVPVIAVSGSNGKTTVTSLIGHLLRRCGKKVFVGGNIGTPILEYLLNHGIYEVVTPKLEDAQIRYARKLPFEKLDYVERTEKYYSIGTAFFINKKELMTAEHVFDFCYFSLHKDFFIRDMEGKVYPVNKVYKCSNRRDMMVFDLKKYPEKITVLNFNRKVEIGDTVFSAGNALGEGISYRAGQVASFTPERAYGEWENIRFSSPASPGNSGGPLLNTEGEVVGLIVRKT